MSGTVRLFGRQRAKSRLSGCVVKPDWTNAEPHHGPQEDDPAENDPAEEE
jgi:hypothetical protein